MTTAPRLLPETIEVEIAAGRFRHVTTRRMPARSQSLYRRR
jgi:hypothetical protein